MAWNSVNIQEQRVRFVVAASRREKPFQELCKEFGISRPTGYVWQERYREQGLAGIAERSRRPQHSPGRTSEGLEQQVIAVRLRFPDWGARKLQVLLQRQGVELPAGTIHRILLRHGLVAEEERRQFATKRFQREHPNELWQMDFKSPLGYDTHVGPLSLLDDCSRYLLTLAETRTTRADIVRDAVAEAFQRGGVPQAMLMDHGTPWWNAKARSGMTWLSVWLMRQGVRLQWSGFRHPQTQGKVERFHGSLDRTMRLRGMPGEQRQGWLDAYRQEYNQVRPHQALQMRTPACVWRRSEKKYDPQPAEWEYGSGAEVRRVDRDGHLYVAGQRCEMRALAGRWVQLVRIQPRVLVYFCRNVVCEVDLGNHRSNYVDRWFPTDPKL